jgi:hypothetical protein
MAKMKRPPTAPKPSGIAAALVHGAAAGNQSNVCYGATQQIKTVVTQVPPNKYNQRRK